MTDYLGNAISQVIKDRCETFIETKKNFSPFPSKWVILVSSFSNSACFLRYGALYATQNIYFALVTKINQVTRKSRHEYKLVPDKIFVWRKFSYEIFQRSMAKKMITIHKEDFFCMKDRNWAFVIKWNFQNLFNTIDSLEIMHVNCQRIPHTSSVHNFGCVPEDGIQEVIAHPTQSTSANTRIRVNRFIFGQIRGFRPFNSDTTRKCCENWRNITIR